MIIVGKTLLNISGNVSNKIDTSYCKMEIFYKHLLRLHISCLKLIEEPAIELEHFVIYFAWISANVENSLYILDNIERKIF